MNKFLKLIEQSLPDEDKQLQYTVLEKIVNIFNKALKGAPSLKVSVEYPDKFVIDIEGDKIIFTLSDMIDGPGDIVQSENAAVYNIDNAVDRLASKSMGGVAGFIGRKVGTKAGKAVTAQKEREAADVQAIDVYRQDTQELIKAIQKAKANRNKQFNVV